MGLKVTDQDLKRSVEYLFSAGFQPNQLGSYVMMGLPDQKIQEVLDAVRFVLSIKIRVNLASFSPIPGTVSWEKALSQGLISINDDPLLGNNTLFPLRSGLKNKGRP